MGFFTRMNSIFQAKMSNLADRMEDPKATLDYSYERQVQLLEQVKRNVVEVTTSRKRLEDQLARAKADAAKLDEQARAAIAAGRDDLAREVLERKAAAQTQIDSIEQQVVDLKAEQEKLADAQQRLAAKVDSFRTQKEVIKAQYTTAEVNARISAAFTGVSEEMTDVGMAVERVQDKTKTLQARAQAVDELVASGQIREIVESDDVGRELEQINLKSQVESDLEKIKAEMAKRPERDGTNPASGELPPASA